ncbi:efflux transporter outer membrane subunit [Mucilaginibacter achroorhodeus]|uniref:Efflux transporter outer membrane subunit n=1 Tax=Mucilaginibacter achroorhodeus TaxID=2599294 RepID=A0A563U285_9SPHI|nr:efflux transporter outer membrane subunit [Mucilaginibacter achroorhodeus]TWR25512.1 efflux transporter outer membrane subunit [Mucilaginibacter achroorhodeus]
MHVKQSTIYKSVLLLLLIVAAGCKTFKPIEPKTNQPLPATFDGSTDTLSAGYLPAANFFKDARLLKLIDTALRANPDLQSALQRIDMAAANVKFNKSLLLPTVNFNARAGLERYGDYTMNGVGNYDTNLSPNINDKQRIPNPTADLFVGFRASWEVDLWGKLKNQKNAALARFLASRSAYRLLTTELTGQIATAYYQLLTLEVEQNVINKNIKLQENALEIVKIQKLGGRATELAVQQFQAQLSHTRGLQFSTTQQIIETENQLRLLTGSFNGTIERDTSLLTLTMPEKLKTGVPTQMLLNRPDVKQAELQLAALNADIKSARAAFFPSLNLSPYTGYNAFKGALLFNPGSAVYGLLADVTAPVLNRGRLKAEYASRIAEGKAALFNYQKTVLNGYQEVINNLKGMENYSKYFDQKKLEVSALKNAVSVANDLYLVGRANYLEVITAQRDVLTAELELANIKRDIFISEVNLYRALGGGWR